MPPALCRTGRARPDGHRGHATLNRNTAANCAHLRRSDRHGHEPHEVSHGSACRSRRAEHVDPLAAAEPLPADWSTCVDLTGALTYWGRDVAGLVAVLRTRRRWPPPRARDARVLPTLVPHRRWCSDLDEVVRPAPIASNGLPIGVLQRALPPSVRGRRMRCSTQVDHGASCGRGPHDRYRCRMLLLRLCLSRTMVGEKWLLRVRSSCGASGRAAV